MKPIRTLIAAAAIVVAAIAPAAAHTPPGHTSGHCKQGHKKCPTPTPMWGPVPSDLPSYCPKVPLQLLLRETLPAQLILTCASYYPTP